MAFKGLFYLSLNQKLSNHVNPNHSIICFGDTEYLVVSCTNMLFMLVKAFSSAVREDEKSPQKHQMKAADLKHQPYRKAVILKTSHFLILREEIAVINYCIPLGTVTLGEVLVNTRRKGTIFKSAA